MILEFLRFNNYKPYYGTNKIVLFSHDDNSPYKKNIILVGGLNGAGKTSFIDSIYICFYGRRMFSKEEYDFISNNAINRRFKREGGRKASIELGISDETGNYIIEVSWEQNWRNEINESRKIHLLDKNGVKLREIASSDEEFNDFIDKRIPLEVSKFFIFDAEKIRELIDEQDQQKTIDAIQKIVSLDLYKQLKADLEHIKYLEELNLSKMVKNEEIQKMVNELEDTTDQHDKLTKLNGEEKTKITQLNTKRQDLEQQRRRKLAQSSQTKLQISKRIGEKEKEIEIINKTLESFSRSSLPYLIISSDIKQLKERLKKEHDYTLLKNREQVKFVSYEEFIGKLIGIDINPPLSLIQKQQLKYGGKKIWAKINHIKETKVEPMQVIHDLSPNDYQRLINWQMSSSINIKKYIDQRYKFINEISELEQQLGQAPDKIDTKEFDDEIEQLTKQLIDLESNRKNREKNIFELRSRKTNLLNEIQRKRKNLQELGPVEQKLGFIDKSIKVLMEFINEVTEIKANHLKSEIELILLKLFRKDEFTRIDFSPKNFTLKIFNKYDEEIDLHTRSAGEKQLIALAMIWALTKVSGSKLPFVIDTPLARLDSIHRSHVVNRYFTSLSDQVIILSTDTEINKEFVEEIDPFVQYSYILEYDNEKESTDIRLGYFNFDGVVQ